ncbi:MAG: hypothetical protein K940chlam8_00593 [Chlamydiae bacterium]|nr:hypothetical protein [Chlamydiota bacterium]
MICAHSPQAKDRVERMFETLQDRWVKKLRLRHISSIEEANFYISELIVKHNKQFGKRPFCDENKHRSLASSEIAHIAFQEKRKLSKNLTLQYQHVLYQIKTCLPNRMRNAEVDIIRRYKEPVRIEYLGKKLEYTTWVDSPPWGAPAVLDHKQVEAMTLTRRNKKASLEIK